ncbi:hypothetical protein [Celeribacter ethanolicus]|uniref:hypothetical protein n=1 Tax=Celeribacter ethanolicus TaxID=1758178 RepID=UPI000830A0EC|nr:hypothetical protein [Celeribacter ethanolicus]
MKPNFALNLSHDGIMLLHRTASGWLAMGEVALDAPDMAAELAELRKLATSVSTAGLATKLVIPNSQILYRALPDPGPEARDAAIRAALDGATPYELDQLVWDSTVSDGTLQIAVLARETLDEAESFATEHRFNPVSFIAIPESGDFAGEPFFGRARSADALIGAETVVEPDHEAMHLLPQRPILTPEAPGAPLPPVEETATPEPETATRESAADLPDTQETHEETPPEMGPEVQPEAHAPQPPEQLELLSDAPATEAASLDTPTEVSATETVEDATAGDLPETTPVSTFHSRRETGADTGEIPTTPAPPRLSAQPSRVLSAMVPAQIPPEDDQRAEPLGQGPKDREDTSAADISAPSPVEHPHVAVTSGEVPVDTPKAPKLKAPRPGKADPLPEPPPMPAPVVAKPTPKTPSSHAEHSEKSHEKSRGAAALGALKSLSARSPKPGTRARKDVPGADIAPAVLPKIAAAAGEDIAPLSDRAAGLDRVENTRDEAEALTVFGARRHNRDSRNKPRHLGLILTGGLVALLLLIGLIAGLLPDEPQPTDVSAVTATQDSPTVIATDDTGAPDGMPGERAPEPMDVAADEEEPELTPELLEQASVPAPPAEAAAEETLDMEALTASYAATGIWPLAPEADTGESAEDDLDTLYTASIDHDIASQDAVALPEATRHIGEAAPRAALPPAPLGTRYEYDEDGFIRATPEGTVTPDGVVVYAGRPQVTTKPRPGSAVDDAVEAALAPAAVAANDPVRLALAKFQPKLRPDTLVENNEKANLGGLTRVELGRIAPRLRPASAQEIAQEMAQEDAEAAGETTAARTAPVVTASLVPKARPRDFDKLASAARAAEAAAAAAAEAGTTSNSNAAKVTAQVPATNIPQAGPANVARAATVNNAINLRKLNLMGVYGSSSDRRALVRLPSGRFAKVKVGDKLDGGRVQSIGADTLTYVKNGRAVTLEIGG